MTFKKLIIFLTVLVLIFAAIYTVNESFTKKFISPKSSLKSFVSIGPVIPKVKKCPIGFILVPGSSLYQVSDFCVMKYDAKCASNLDLNKGIQPSPETACLGNWGVYKNSGKGCSCRGDKQVVSTASGFPVTYLPMQDSSSDNAKAYCQSQGWHLMTNQEWMTIARNTEQQPQNWCDRDGSHCGFSPGTAGKILANGHNDDQNEASFSGSTHGALVASSDDKPCFGTTTDGSNICGGKSSQKRTLILSNGEVIWDLAGNIWNWVDAEVARKDQPQSKTDGVLDRGWTWSEFAGKPSASVIIDNGREPSLGYDSFRPSNPDWNSDNGVGRIYHFSALSDNNTTEYAFIRGGNWRHGYDSGAFCVHLSPQADKAGIDDVGFRCVTGPSLE